MRLTSDNEVDLTAIQRRVPPIASLSTTDRDPQSSTIDIGLAAPVAADFLAALGVPVDQKGLSDTPGRMAFAYAQLLTPPTFVPTIFPNEPHYAELVVVRDIRFASVCEHHMLPFIGTVDIGWSPDEVLAGLSKLAWAVKAVSHRVQVQERMTTQLSDWLEKELTPRAVAVRVTAEHMACRYLRGAQTPHASTVTQVHRGCLESNPQLCAEWAQLL